VPRLEVVKGVAGQRIYFYPQEGRPTATPTVELKDEGGSTIRAAASTYVTQDTTTTTVGTASLVGATSLILSAVTGVTVRSSYLVTNAIGQQEWIRVRSCNASTKAVEVDEPLEYAHDTAATLVATGFYYTLQTSDVANLEELWRARATYTVGGLTYTQEVPFDVVLTQLRNPLTVEFIKYRRPDIMTLEFSQSRGSDFADFRSAAWDEVLRAIRGHDTGWRPALVRTPEDLEGWALAEFDVLAQSGGISILRGWDAERAVLHLESIRDERRGAALASLKFLDLDEDDSADEDEEQPARMDFIR